MRREQRRWRLVEMVLAGVLVMLGMTRVVSAKGAPGVQQQTRPMEPIGDAAGPNLSDPVHTKLQEQQARAATDERRKRIVADTDKLLVLATELKQEVDKSTKDELSVTAVQRAADIEKLAHQVKERIKGN